MIPKLILSATLVAVAAVAFGASVASAKTAQSAEATKAVFWCNRACIEAAYKGVLPRPLAPQPGAPYNAGDGEIEEEGDKNPPETDRLGPKIGLYIDEDGVLYDEYGTASGGIIRIPRPGGDELPAQEYHVISGECGDLCSSDSPSSDQPGPGGSGDDGSDSGSSEPAAVDPVHEFCDQVGGGQDCYDHPDWWSGWNGSLMLPLVLLGRGRRRIGRSGLN